MKRAKVEQWKREGGRESKKLVPRWTEKKRMERYRVTALSIGNNTECMLNINCDTLTSDVNFFPETPTICSQCASRVRRREPARLQTIDPWTILTIYSSLISIYYAIDAIRHVNRGIIGARDGRLRPREAELAKVNRTRRYTYIHIRNEPNY